MRLVTERLNGEERRKYRTAVQHAALYRAAARLWVKGVGMADAISIVESAMKDAGEL